jgi:hypothetical protein
MDFYARCAYFWGISHWEAKTRIIEWFYTDVTMVSGGMYVQINPKTLTFIPAEARAEALEFQGIVLGDN